MSACTVFELQREVLPPESLAQLLARIEDELGPKIAAGATAPYWERNMLRTTCRHLAKMLETPVDLVQIEQIAELTAEDYIRGLGCTLDRAGHHVSAQKKLLKYAPRAVGCARHTAERWHGNPFVRLFAQAEVVQDV